MRPLTIGSIRRERPRPRYDLVKAAAVLGAAILQFTGAAEAQPSCTAQWVPGHMNGPVHALLVLPGGDVIAGGEFTTAGSVSANRIARWNTTTDTWTPLGAGLNGTVFALARTDGGELIAGGSFTINNGTSAFIARWDPVAGAWMPLGVGMDGRVFALLAMPGGELLAGGEFGHAGNVAARAIARWNPVAGTWSGPGMSDRFAVVHTLSVHPSGDVIVGGGFTRVGGDVIAYNIARWNTTSDTWSPLGAGSGLERWCYVGSATALSGGDIIAAGVIGLAEPFGGYFGIGRFQPASGTWSSLSGSPGNMFGLLQLPDGSVIAGGDLVTPVGYPTRIARWDPETAAWSSLDATLNGWVRALVQLPGGGIVVGGEFTDGDGDGADYITRLTLAEHFRPGIIAGPGSGSACATGMVKFTAPAIGAGALSHVWQIETAPGVWENLGTAPIPLPCGGMASVTAADPFTDHPTIAIRPCGGGARQHYQVRAVISDAYCSTTTLAATYSVCPADVNCSGSVSVQDIFDFLNAYFLGLPAADLTGEGTVSVEDIFQLLAAYFAGCT